MTGKQKIEAALSSEGTNHIPAVICYEDIAIRDHWDQVTKYPWWYQFDVNIDKQICLKREVLNNMGIDWYTIHNFGNDDDRKNFTIELLSDGVYLTDKKNSRKHALKKPEISGGIEYAKHILGGSDVDTIEKINNVVPALKNHTEIEIAKNAGCYKMGMEMVRSFNEFYPIAFASAPMNYAFQLWGVEEAMIKTIQEPMLIKHLNKRHLDLQIAGLRDAAYMGASGIFIQDCYTDMINPDVFKKLHIEYTAPLIEEIRSLKMKSIYYFCGNPKGKLDMLLSMRPDALSPEEGKKNFINDINELADFINGRCTLLGNLDAIGVLQNGTTDVLKTEIIRQINAGKKNKGKFIMSLGSPVTPSTPINKVRLYCDLVHELGII